MSFLNTTRADAAPLSLPVRSEFDVGHVIGCVSHFCARHGLSRVTTAYVATAASELANNLWMHALAGGRLQMAPLRRAGALGVELVAEDAGPGIADMALAMTEGWSSVGSLGCGLAGVQRLMDEFSIASAVGSGTRVVARKWQRLRVGGRPA